MSSFRIYPQRRPLGHGRVDSANAPVKPRDASTLIVWRHGLKGAEVLMGRRSRSAAFVPDFFVFPGGRVDPGDYAIRSATPLDLAAPEHMGVRGDTSLAEALAIAAVREIFEETGLMLAGAATSARSQTPNGRIGRHAASRPSLIASPISAVP